MNAIDVIITKDTVYSIYGMKFTVQEFLLHHDRHGVQFFTIMEKGLFIVQILIIMSVRKSKIIDE